MRIHISNDTLIKVPDENMQGKVLFTFDKEYFNLKKIAVFSDKYVEESAVIISNDFSCLIPGDIKSVLINVKILFIDPISKEIVRETDSIKFNRRK